MTCNTRSWHEKWKEAIPFIELTFLHLHVYNVLLINNSKLGDYLDCIYHFELELNDTTGTIKSDSTIDQHINITVSAG